ncbi:MAG: transposase family protein [Holophagales bacterium]|nr:transposase family protein [Holophagales bacterium]
MRLTKVARLLGREGTEVPYSTLYRFSKEELGFGKATPTIAVLEGEPGQELQVDTGSVGWLWGEGGKRKLKAWIFTATRSRHRFVYPTLTETTKDAIEACEAAWRFYGGVFRVLLPDNTSAIVDEARNLRAQIQQTFLEYAQSRGFVVDPARAGHPKDKARVERSVSHVRGGLLRRERLKTLEEAGTSPSTGACGSTALAPTAGRRGRRWSTFWPKRRAGCCLSRPSSTTCRAGARRRWSATSTSRWRRRCTRSRPDTYGTADDPGRQGDGAPVRGPHPGEGARPRGSRRARHGRQ